MALYCPLCAIGRLLTNLYITCPQEPRGTAVLLNFRGNVIDNIGSDSAPEIAGTKSQKPITYSVKRRFPIVTLCYTTDIYTELCL